MSMLNKFTKLELEMYNKIFSRKWEELEAKIDTLDDVVLNPIIVIDIFKTKRWNIVKKLFYNNNIEDLNIKSIPTKDTLLMLAISDTTKEAQEVSKYLIDNGAKKDCINNNGLTALMIACENNNIEMFRYLLEKGDDIDTITNKNTVLISAVKGGNKDIIGHILNNSKNINVTIDGKNALDIAIKEGKYDIANMLIYSGLYTSNKYLIVDYIRDNGDIDLIYHILKNNKYKENIKHEIIKVLVEKYDINEWVKIKDKAIKEDIARFIFENNVGYKFLDYAVNGLLKTDLKEYVLLNFSEYIKAYKVDKCVRNNELSADLTDIDKIDVILKSSGVGNDILAKYILIVAIEKIYKEHIEDFNLSKEEFNALLAYQLINTMQDDVFRERYKEYYFKNIMLVDEEVYNRLEGDEKKDYVLHSVYNWFVGKNIYKDNMYAISQDISTLIKDDLTDYKIDELHGIKRIKLDKKEYVKDILNYTLLAIKYLSNVVQEREIKDIKSIYDILLKKDDNLKILRYILNDKEIFRKKDRPQGNSITQSYMNWAIDNSYVFIRGIEKVSNYSESSIHNETNIEIELRKGIRKKGKPTLTKIVGDKDGNLNRSCTMINYGSRVFTEVGLGIIEPSIKDIVLVASHNIGTGKGKKTKLTRVIKGDLVIDSNAPIEVQLQDLAEYLKRGGGTKKHNEVVMNINLNRNNVCVFYSNNNDSINFLKAVYVKRKYTNITGKNIHIFKIDKNYHYPVKKIYNTREIKTSLKEAFLNHTSEILDVSNIDFLLVFKDEIQKIPECKLKVEQFIKSIDCKNVNDCINASKLIGEYYSNKEQDRYISTNLYKFIQKENYLPYMKDKLCINEDAKRSDREIEFYFETMDNIAKYASKETLEEIKNLSEDTFKKVCEHAIKLRHTKDIDTLFKKCENKPYITLNEETKEYINRIKEERDEKERKFFEEYNITPRI